VSGAGATYEGGGLAALGDVTVTASAFELNFIGDSGGVCSGCHAYGGGVFAAGTVAVTATTFLANRADCGAKCTGVGGGIMAISDVGIVGGSFAGNSASCQTFCDLVGGGVFAPAISVAASSFDGNHVDCVEFCDNVGGGFTSGTIEVSSSSMTNNTARCEAGCQAQGGGFFGGGPVQNGAQSYSSGGGAAGPGWGGAGADAAAVVLGAVAIDHSAFSGNVASCSTGACGGSGGSGGGFYSGDPTAVDIHSSTFDHNTAFLAGGAADVEARANPPVSVVNSTITQNSSGSGGALTLHAGPATIAYDTIVQNIVTNPVAAVAVPTVPANLTASNPVFFGTIIALPVGGPNCVVSGASSQGYNFSDDATCGLDQATDHVATPNDPGLGALGSNGGPTQTMLPQTGSPVIDAIPVAACQTGGAAGITVDQRGVTRPQGPGCDIGAVEVEFVVPTPTPSPAVIITPKFTG
jgi:fibronectin-binding autotransporter adhesin